MIERDAEMAASFRVLDDARRGRGALLVVEGAAGIGKSELCAAIADRATADGMRVLSARGGEYEQDVPYGVARQLFERAVREESPDGPARLLSGPAALAGGILHAADHRERLSAETGADHGLFWLVCNIAAGAPTVLLLDDAHWADPQSLRFLLYLARRIDGLATVVILARRPDEPGQSSRLLDEIAAQPSADRIALAPLSPTGAARLIAQRHGGPLPPAITQACHAVSGGVPFYVAQIADGLTDVRDADDAEVIRHVQSQVPAAVRHAILLRLGRLGPTARPVAEALAVLGDAATVQTLQSVSRLGTEEVLAALDELVSGDILTRNGPPAFNHPIIRTAVYGELAQARRRALHGRAARTHADLSASAELVAHHLLHSEPASDQWAVGLLRQVAGDASRHGAFDSAVAMLTRAVAEPPDAADRAGVLAELGEAELLAGAAADAAAHLRAALESVPPPAAPLAATLALSRALFHTGGAISAIELLDAAAAAFQGDDRLRLGVERTALAQFIPGYGPEAQQTMHSYANLPGETPTERAALAMAGLARAYDPAASVTDALPLARRALADGQLIAELTCEAPEVGNAAYVVHFAEQTGEFARIIDLCFDDARARGSAFGYLSASLSGLLQATQQGAVPAAIAHGEAALAMWPDVAHTPQTQRWVSAVVRFLTEALLAAGDTAHARELVHSWSTAGDLATPELAMIRYAQALLVQFDGEHELALTGFMSYGRDIAVQGWEDRTTPWRLGAARSAAALGDHDRALELADEALAIATTWDTAGGQGTAQLVRAQLDRTDQMQPRVEQAVATLRRSPCRLQLADALLTHGVAQRRAGNRAGARAALTDGLDLSASCGATPLVARARAELNILGARPRRDRSTGRFALTPSEARIASLAAQGHTNRQIAQQLFITPKTVELHLTNVYRKLQITSRTMLPSALG